MIEQGDLVTLDNGLIRRSMTLGGDGSLKLESFERSASGYDWAAQGEPADIYLQMGETILTGLHPAKDSGLLVAINKSWRTALLNLSIEAAQETSQAKITLFYTIFTNSSVIEHRLTIENQGDKPLPSITRFDPLTFWLRGDQGLLQAYSVDDVADPSDL